MLVHKFKNIFDLEFYADPLASMLLRKVFFETEKVADKIVERAQGDLEKNEEPAAENNKEEDIEAAFMNYKVEEVKPFSMEEYMAVRYQGTQAKSEGDLSLITDWNSAMVCQALHSEN